MQAQKYQLKWWQKEASEHFIVSKKKLNMAVFHLQRSMQERMIIYRCTQLDAKGNTMQLKWKNYLAFGAVW